MVEEIVRRLTAVMCGPIHKEAADHIEALEAEVDAFEKGANTMTDARKIISRVELNLHPMDGAVVSNLRCTVGVKNTDAIIAALAAAGLVIANEKQFVEVACMLYCLGAADRVNGRGQNAVPASKQAWRELRAMVEAAKDE